MKKIAIQIFLIAFLLFPQILFAQNINEISLAITPPLVKNNVSPGQTWNSSVKLVNNNPIEIEAYFEIRDFTGGPETGTVVFLDENNQTKEGKSYLLSQWITINKEPVVIPPFESIEIPYSINVPVEAEPGGHYAAILAGTKPPKHENGGSAIKVSSLLASLILMNVKGDVVEKGAIREFSTDKTVYASPKVDFKVRFENTGNVHIQPQGEIKITNFLNKDVAALRINHNTDYGNVLPMSIRKWDYSWEIEDGFLTMGRYKAVLILGYGEQGRGSATSTIFFWVINWKLIFSVIGLALFAILTIMGLIRTYIRRAIVKTQKMAGMVVPHKDSQKHKITVVPEGNGEDKQAKIINKTNNKFKEEPSKKKVGWTALKFILLLILLLLIVLLAYIWKQEQNSSSLVPAPRDKDESVIVEDTKVLQKDEVIEKLDKETENTIESDMASSTLDIEHVTKPEEQDNASTTTISEEANKENKQLLGKETFNITVLNGTGQSGTAGRVAELLEKDGFLIAQTGNADNYNYFNTLIQYSKNSFEAATYISRFLPIEPELEEVQGTDSITVIIGRDFK